MTLLYTYIGALVLGGILLAASLFLGGDHDHGGDLDADHDLHLDHDADLDADASALWLPVFSLRFWVFFLCFFGLTGASFTLLALAGRWVTLGSAVGVGLLTGAAAAYTIRRLGRDAVGRVSGAADHEGRTGKLLLPIAPDRPGKVRLTVGGQVVDLPARSDEPGGIPRGAAVLVLEHRGDHLVVVPAPEGARTDIETDAGDPAG